jgi:hypothetical protein
MITSYLEAVIRSDANECALLYAMSSPFPAAPSTLLLAFSSFRISDQQHIIINNTITPAIQIV